MFFELGAEVIRLGTEPNGLNINADCGSNHPELLRETVLRERADLGIALDGDADRLVLVDDRGNLVDGDQLLALVAASWRADGRVRGGGIVATVMSNLGLERHLDGLGLETIGVRLDEKGRVKPDDHLRIAEDTFVIGDPAGPEMHTHLAHYEGEIAIHIALGEKVKPDFSAIPRATYTDPETGSVGLRLDEELVVG